MRDSVRVETGAELRDAAMTSETGSPVFLQGVFPFIGCGLLSPALLHVDLCLTVPPTGTARLIYFRAGNASDALIYLSVMVDGRVHRYFPIGPQDATHVPLAIREGIPGGTRIEIYLAAATGVLGTAIVDAGLIVAEMAG